MNEPTNLAAASTSRELRQTSATVTESLPPAPLQVDILAPADVARNPRLVDEWQRRTEASANIYRLYHSPAWWDHLRASHGDETLRLIVVSTTSGAIRGIVPCQLRTLGIVRHAAGRQVVVTRGPGVELLGSEPLVDASDDVYEAVLRALWRVFPEAGRCRLKSLQTSSPFCRLLDSASPRRAAVVNVSDGARRPFYSIYFEQGWKEYMTRFNGKQRNDLQRKQRLLAEHLGTALTFRRLTTADDVRQSYSDLSIVATRARVRIGRELPDENLLVDAAERGLLRAYLMHGGETPLAYVIGYQAFGVYHYSDVAFSAESTKSSPGVVLLYHVIKDVCDHAPARWFNFGVGDAEYKRRFSNVVTEDVTMFLFPKTLTNRIRVLGLRSLNVAHQIHRSRRVVPPVKARSAGREPAPTRPPAPSAGP